ncbi:MAG: hypothetical protein HGA42_20145, partial [Nostocales cyanobacterium W4_Combined_metabat2_030]|nr:hypothetical protein [Nostocales cyanobacterium W4_Combined_metabat2_030]
TVENVPTLDSLRHFLKQKLPNYMVPAAFVMLEAFPLNPNGKVDRRALPAPNQHQKTPKNTYVSPRTSIEQKLAKILGNVLGINHQISIHDNFFYLGGHSLLSVRLVAEIEKTFNQKLPLAALFKLSTIAEIAIHLEADKTTENAVQEISISLFPSSSLEPEIYRQLLAYTAGWQGKRIADNSLIVGVNTETLSQPVFWCVNGFGEIEQLSKYFGTHQPLYGLCSGYTVMELTEKNITALATHHIQEILTVQPKGSYLIGGYCAGTRIAVEIAQQLWQQGKFITLLALVDPPVMRPKPEPYPGRLALFFGSNSHLNPYQEFRWPEWGWRKFYPGGFSLDLIPGDHWYFNSEAYAEILAEKIQTRIKLAQAIATPYPILSNQVSYSVLPDLAYQAQLTAPLSLVAKPGEIIDFSVTVKNMSPVVWPHSAASGITLGNHWLDKEGNVVFRSDGRVALLQNLPPNAEVVLSLSVKAPMAVGEYILQLDLVEEGVIWFQQKGSKTTPINVKVSEDPVVIQSESRLNQIQGDLERSHDRLSQIKAFLE